MRKHWPIPILAAAVPAALYGALYAFTPAALPTEDIWTRAFLETGLDVQLRSVSKGAGRYFMILERRDGLKSPEYDGTVLREFVIDGFKAQVASFPPGASLEEIVPEGSKKNFSPKPRLPSKPSAKRDARPPKFYHVCRVGRHVLTMQSLGPTNVPFLVPRDQMPDKLVNRLFEIFKRTAQEHEDSQD